MRVDVDIDEAAIRARVADVDAFIRGRARQSIGRLTLKLQRNIKRDKLTGQVLGVQTGTLRRSIDRVVRDGQDNIDGVVWTNVKYGLAHEYGFRGAVSVRTHLRQIKQAFGRSISPRAVNVNAHTRNVNMPERSFLRTALREMEQEIRSKFARNLNR